MNPRASRAAACFPERCRVRLRCACPGQAAHPATVIPWRAVLLRRAGAAARRHRAVPRPRVPANRLVNPPASRPAGACARSPGRVRCAAAVPAWARSSPPASAAASVRCGWALAHSVGSAARGVGRQAATAKEIDPEHRRDGAGLLLLGLSILVAVAVWAGSAGPVGRWLSDTVRLFFGGLSVLLPLLLLYAAIRLFASKPADPEHRGRSLVGWTTLIVATAGLLHIARQPDQIEVNNAGGLIGYGVGALLVRAVTAWVAVPLLVLLLLFGLLVITATPISKIPERLVLLTDVLLGRTGTPSADPASAAEANAEGDGEGDGAGEDEPLKRRRPARRRQGSLADLGLDSDAEPGGDDDGLILHDTIPVPRAETGGPRGTEPPSTRRCATGPRSRHPVPGGDYRSALLGVDVDSDALAVCACEAMPAAPPATFCRAALRSFMLWPNAPQSPLESELCA